MAASGKQVTRLLVGRKYMFSGIYRRFQMLTASQKKVTEQYPRNNSFTRQYGHIKTASDPVHRIFSPMPSTLPLEGVQPRGVIDSLSRSKEDIFTFRTGHKDNANNSHYGHSGGRRKANGERRFGVGVLPGYALAFSLFSKEKNELEEAHEKLKNVDALEMLLRQAKLAEHKKEWQDADKYYHEALALLDSRRQDRSWDDAKVLDAQVYIFDNMANLALSRGHLNEAEVLYKETMKGLFGKGRPHEDNAIVELSLKLAMIYAMQRRNKDAEEGFKFCMDTQEKKMLNAEKVDDDTLGLLGMCINSYSRFLIIHGRVSEAYEALTKTVGIAEKALGENHPQTAVLHSDLATTATMLNDLDGAKAHIEKALDIANKCKSSDAATIWCNRGLIYLERGEFVEAEKSCKKALQLAQENNDKDMEKEAVDCLEEIKTKRKEK